MNLLWIVCSLAAIVWYLIWLNHHDIRPPLWLFVGDMLLLAGAGPFGLALGCIVAGKWANRGV